MDDVLIVGAGPVGLTMACELARHGVRSRIIDRAPTASAHCRAIGVTPRTLEVWEGLGLAREMIDSGVWLIGTRSVSGSRTEDQARTALDLPYAPLGVPQYATEGVLTRHLTTRGIEIERGVELHDVAAGMTSAAVSLTHPDGTPERATFRYVVGCDGAHSKVRRCSGIDFDGEAYPWSFMLGDVSIDWSLPYGYSFRAVRPKQSGPPDLFIAIPLPEHNRYRISMLSPTDSFSAGGTEHGIQAEIPGPGLHDLQAVADDLVPDKPVLSDLRWSSIFRISMRLASAYRKDSVFIAGDAAHIHPPTGGQGMNTGIQDAHNLAWKMAAALKHRAAEDILNSYQQERRPVGAQVIARTRLASERLGRDRPDASSRLTDAQMDISYRGTRDIREDAVAAAGPEAGDRAPEVGGLECAGHGFALRLSDVLNGCEHVLLVNLDEANAGAAEDVAQFARHVNDTQSMPIRVVIVAKTPMPNLPGIRMLIDNGRQFSTRYGDEARAFLVRPDRHIAWRGVSWSRGLVEYLRDAYGRFSA